MSTINTNLTPKQKDIMTVLWSVNKPLTVSEICIRAKELGIDLNTSTVQVTVNKMINDNLIRVGGIIQANTVLARAFEPIISKDELVILEFKKAMKPLGKTGITGLVSALLEHEEVSDSECLELMNIIEEMKEK